MIVGLAGRARRPRRARRACGPRRRREGGERRRSSGRGRASGSPARAAMLIAPGTAASNSRVPAARTPRAASAVAGSWRWSAVPNSTARNGRPSASSTSTDADREQRRPAHDVHGRAGPARHPLAAAARRAGARRNSRPHVERVDPAAEQHQAAPGAPASADAGGEQRRPGCRRRRTTAGSTAGRPARLASETPMISAEKSTVRPAVRRVADDRLDGRLAPRQLVAVAAHEQQRVVDGEPEPERGGEVLREHRHVGEAR